MIGELYRYSVILLEQLFHSNLSTAGLWVAFQSYRSSGVRISAIKKTARYLPELIGMQ